MYRNVFWRGGSVSWKKDIIDDMKQHYRGGSANYPGPPDADHPYVQTAHLSCKELNAISEVQFVGDETEAALQREQHYRDLRDKAECLGVSPRSARPRGPSRSGR